MGHGGALEAPPLPQLPAASGPKPCSCRALTVPLLPQVLAGDEQVYYCCEKCKENTAATLYMRIHRFPPVLQLHIKRFKYAGALFAVALQARFQSRRRAVGSCGRSCGACEVGTSIISVN